MSSRIHAEEGMTALKDSGWNRIDTRFPINVKASLESGQPLSFHSTYNITNGIAKVCYVTQKGAIELSYKEGRLQDTVFFRHHGNYTKKTASEEITKRFGLEDDMEDIYKKISTDKHIKKAIDSHYGMRVTHNDPWETTLCFVISQFNNIKRIKGIVRNLINSYGAELESGNTLTRIFPEPEAIAEASVEDLAKAGAGFRAKYIKNVATAVSNNFDLDRIHGMDYQEGKEYLMEMEGIGDKVADCILLMGYKKLNAFPIDVWIKRSMEDLYMKNKKANISEIHSLADEKWGGYAGYAQQYLFHHARNPVYQ